MSPIPRLLRTLATPLLLLVAGPASARPEGPAPDAEGRRVGPVEHAGRWKAWTVSRWNPWSRALVVQTRLVRSGPGTGSPPRSEAPEGAPSPDGWELPEGGEALGPPVSRQALSFRLHEEGWVVATAGPTTRVYPPGATVGVQRSDLWCSALSRFVSAGFLSVRPETASPGAGRLRLSFAPLGPEGLGPPVALGTIELPAGASTWTATSISLEVGDDALEVRWCVPLGPAAPLRGALRLERGTGAVTALAAPAGPPTVTVAAVQMASLLGDVPGNLERIERLVAQAARAGAKLVVLPETAVNGYLSQDLQTTWQIPGRPRAPSFTAGRDPRPGALVATSPVLERLLALAGHFGVHLTVPFLESGARVDGVPAAAYYNAVLLATPEGWKAHYRKLSPWPHPEQSWATPGNLGLAPADTPWGRVGLAVCFDVHTVFRRYAEEDRLWALLYPIAWVSDGDDEDWFSRALPERVKAAGFHVVGANWSVDAPQPWHGYGWSTVIDRQGRVVAQARTRVGPEVVLAELPFGPAR